MQMDIDQQLAATASATNLMVLAAPGSGKSRTLCERVKWHLSQGCNPDRIICLTYTNAAAEVFAERLAPVKLHFMGTLHGFALRLLQKHGSRIGLNSGSIAVMDDRQSEELMATVIKELNLKTSVKKVSEDTVTRPMLIPAIHYNAEATARLEYRQRMLRTGMLDFDHILLFARELLVNLNLDPIGPKLNFDALLCDEVQDASALDMDIYRLIPARSKFYVGDEAQSIFAFRGADVKAVMEHANREDVTVMELRNNYRSDTRIIDYANRVLAMMTGRHAGSKMRAVSQSPGEVQKVWGLPDVESQFNWIADDLQNNERLTAFEDCAVLVRTHALAALCRDKLKARGIPVKERKQDQKPPDWGRCRMFVNLLVNPDNDLLAHWWLRETRGEREADAVKLKALAAYTTINRSMKLVPPGVTVALLPNLLCRAGVQPESMARVKRVLDKLPPEATLSDASGRLGEEETANEDAGQGVAVQTAHSAKGCEWATCYVPCLNDGIWPSRRDDPEEVKRLFFVSVTRPKHRLVLLNGATIPDWSGKPQPAKPSPFCDL